MESQLFVAVVRNRSVISASRLRGFLSSLDGYRVDDVRVIAGPLSAELIRLLHTAFPETYIITSYPVPPSDKKIISLPGVNFSSFRIPQTIHVTGAKGGVGKTTITLLLAYHCANARNLTTCVIDRDEQAGSTLMLARTGQISEVYREEPLQVTNIFANVRFVPNIRGNTIPIPDEVVGGVLGVQIAICDHGNSPHVPQGENSILVAGVGEDMLRLLTPALTNFRGTVVINPNYGESRRDVERMVREVRQIAPDVNVLTFPHLPVNRWGRFADQVPDLARFCYRELERIVHAATTFNTMDDGHSKTGTGLGKL